MQMGRKHKAHETHRVSTSKVDGGVMTADAALLHAVSGEGR